MSTGPLVFRVHAIKRMFQRQISKDDVRHVLETGEAIEAYPHDTPYPSRLGVRMAPNTSAPRGSRR